MTTFSVGCAGFASQRTRYVSKLAFVEFDLRAPSPSPKTLAGYKKSMPEGFAFSAVAPASIFGDPSWPLKDPIKVQSEFDRFANLVDALGAKVVVFRTPMSISPGSVALKRFEDLLTRARRIADVVVWEPAGLWQYDEARAWAKSRGVVVASDPLHDKVEGPVVYARMRGLGADTAYTMARLESLADKLDGVETAYVVFQSANAWREAVGFRKLVDEVFAEASDEAGDDEDDLDDDEDGEEGDEDGDDDGEYEDDEEDGDDEDDDEDEA